jgi:hypothetical protein
MKFRFQDLRMENRNPNRHWGRLGYEDATEGFCLSLEFPKGTPQKMKNMFPIDPQVMDFPLGTKLSSARISIILLVALCRRSVPPSSFLQCPHQGA